MTGEFFYEKHIMDKLELKYGRMYCNLEAYIWLKEKFGTSLKMRTLPIRCFANVVSEYCQIPIYREHYRRLSTLIYWLQENLEEIKTKLFGKTLCFLLAHGAITKIDF